jgi:hypothetical protein
MEDEHTPAAEQVGGGEASLGEAQSENPATDDEMIDEPSEGEEGGGESGTPDEYDSGLGDEDEDADVD